MATGGSYRLQSSTLNKQFQAPRTTTWNEQPIAAGLNGIPVNSSYKIHIMNFGDMIGCDFEDLATLFETQQTANSQLQELETDPYDASGANKNYGTTTYTDFIIQNIAPRTRGLPLYPSVTITLEVFVG